MAVARSFSSLAASLSDSKFCSNAVGALVLAAVDVEAEAPASTRAI